jgi:hypothetical protein
MRNNTQIHIKHHFQAILHLLVPSFSCDLPQLSNGEIGTVILQDDIYAIVDIVVYL